MALTTTPASPAVYRCQAEDGSMLFSQFACPPGTHIELPQGSASISVVQIPPLTTAEHRALEALARSAEQLARDNRKKRRRQRQQAARARSESRAQCERAEAALDKIASTRRQGYSAKRGRALDDQEENWRQLMKAHC